MRLAPVSRTGAIGHELCYAANGDKCPNFHAERLAGKWATGHLIEVDLVEKAAANSGDAPSVIVSELDITPECSAPRCSSINPD